MMLKMRQDEWGFFRSVPFFLCITKRTTQAQLWARFAPSMLASFFLGLLALLSPLNNLFLRKLFKQYFLFSTLCLWAFVYCSVCEDTSSPDYSTSFDRCLYYPAEEDLSRRHCFLHDFIWQNWCVLLNSFWNVLLWDFMLSCIKNCKVLLFKNQ